MIENKKKTPSCKLITTEGHSRFDASELQDLKLSVTLVDKKYVKVTKRRMDTWEILKNLIIAIMKPLIAKLPPDSLLWMK